MSNRKFPWFAAPHRVIHTLQGGEGTFDEMCLTFLFYYPLQDITLCTSMPEPQDTYTALREQLQ